MSESVKLTCTTCGQMNRVSIAKLSGGAKCGICGAGLVTGKVAELDPATHDKATRGDGLPILIDYWAPWCGPCRAMAPEFAQAAQAMMPAVRFAKINTEDHPQISQALEIRGIPLLILYARGREIARLPGVRPSAEIAAFVRSKLPATP